MRSTRTSGTGRRGLRFFRFRAGAFFLTFTGRFTTVVYVHKTNCGVVLFHTDKLQFFLRRGCFSSLGRTCFLGLGRVFFLFLRSLSLRLFMFIKITVMLSYFIQTVHSFFLRRGCFSSSHRVNPPRRLGRQSS